MTESDCPLCASKETEKLLWQNDFSRVIRVDDKEYPGFCRVILNSHRSEMTDLSESERQRLMSIVFAVEKAVREIVQPDKINLASLGNYVSHLHWHVIPRWREDATFPDAIWAAARRRGKCRNIDTVNLRQTLQARLVELLGQCS